MYLGMNRFHLKKKQSFRFENVEEKGSFTKILFLKNGRFQKDFRLLKLIICRFLKTVVFRFFNDR